MSTKQKIISVKACFSLLFYLIIPSCAICMILSSYPELSKDRFIAIIHWILPTAIIIVFLAQCSSIYQRGQFKYYLCNIGFVIMTMIWVYGVIGGKLIVTDSWNEFDFSIHLSKYILLILTVASVNIIYYTLEWRFYKQTRYHHDVDDTKPPLSSSESAISL